MKLIRIIVLRVGFAYSILQNRQKVETSEIIKNKRLLGIDFGLVRVGVAVTDELHISVAPKETLLFQKSDFWEKLIKIIESERIGGIVIGVPYEENEEHDMRSSIEEFISDLSSRTDIPIFYQDESFSSIQAVNIMLKIGKKKKKRTQAGIKDRVAAAIILQNFLKYVE